jgi:cell division protein FtsL
MLRLHRSPRAGRQNQRAGVHPVVAYGLLAFGLLLAFVWEQASVDHLLIRLERAKAERRNLESRVAALSVQADDLSSLVQVEERAVRELGLRRPATDEIVELQFAEPPSNEHFALGKIVPDADARTRRGQQDR